MAKHITDKDLQSIIGDLNNIKYLEDDACKDLVSILNELIERIMILEDNSPNANTVARSNNVLPIEGIKI